MQVDWGVNLRHSEPALSTLAELGVGSAWLSAGLT